MIIFLKKFTLLVLCFPIFIWSDITSSITTLKKTDEQLVDEINDRVFRKLYLENELRPYGTGAQMMNEIKMLALSFIYCKPASQEKARELLVAATNEFLGTINNSEEIREYLYKYPLTLKNIEIQIFFVHADGSSVSPGELCGASAIDGILDYKIESSSGRRFRDHVKESYEEAVEKLKLIEMNNDLIQFLQ